MIILPVHRFHSCLSSANSLMFNLQLFVIILAHGYTILSSTRTQQSNQSNPCRNGGRLDAFPWCSDLVWTLGYQLMYAGRIFPGVSVAAWISPGFPPTMPRVKLSQTFSYPITGKVLFRDAGKVWVASPAELGMVFDPSSSALAAYRLGHEAAASSARWPGRSARGTWAQMWPRSLSLTNVWLIIICKISRLRWTSRLLKPVLQVEGTNVIAQPGQVGRHLNMDATLIYLGAQLQSFRDGEVPLVIQETPAADLDVASQADAARQHPQPAATF